MTPQERYDAALARNTETSLVLRAAESAVTDEKVRWNRLPAREQAAQRDASRARVAELQMAVDAAKAERRAARAELEAAAEAIGVVA